MSAAITHTKAIDFGDGIFNHPSSFDFAENELYNLSIPLLSILLTIERLPKPENLAVFKNSLKQQIVDMSEQGNKLQYPSAVIDKLCCLHCIVLDEFIIHSRWGASVGWENNTLLSELFNLPSGGDLFFTITEKAMRQPEKMIDLLTIVYVFLQMGFKGRFRSRQSEKLGLIVKQVSSLIKENIKTPNVLISQDPVTKALLLKSNRRYVLITVFTLAAIAAVFTFFDYWFEETYSARSKEFRELNKVVTSYSQVEVKTVPPEYRVDKSLNDDQSSVVNQEEQTAVAKAVINQVNEQQKFEPPMTTSLYRVQLSSFSTEENANKFQATVVNNPYNVAIKRLGNYYIVYSVANSATLAEQQQQFYQETYQISAIIFEIDTTSNTAL